MTAPSPIQRLTEGTEVVVVLTAQLVQYNMAGDWVHIRYGTEGGEDWSWVPTDTITPL